jgi:peroxiredoxin
MKKILSFILLCININGFSQKIGEPVPEINLGNVTGDKISLQALKGKVVLLDFWASWCGPCKVANKNLQKIYKKYKAKGFEIYSVSVDSRTDKWKDAIKEQKIKWLQVNDPGDWNSEIAKTWGIEALPTTFLIDKNGILRYFDLEGKKLTEQIDKMLKE